MNVATRVLTNARIVLEHEIVQGSVSVVDGRIASVDPGPAPATAAYAAEDLGGDWLLPGLVELHTDHLENHCRPRPGVSWPTLGAIQAHDAQISAAGITTVLDCLRIGRDDGVPLAELHELTDTLRRAETEGRLRSAHLLHLRCEVSEPAALDEFETFADASDVHLVSLMDHAPGQRQFASLDAAALYYQSTLGYDDDAFESFATRRLADSAAWANRHRGAIAAACREGGIPLASHDDATVAHVDESDALGVTIAEFPTSMDAACRSRERGMAVLMGAPNVVRGLSHSGNVSARELAAAGRLDVLSSDYVPCSLLHAVFLLALELRLLSLPEAVALVSANPARAIGLEGCGRIARGLAADLVQVAAAPGDVPLVRRVWRAGRRVS